jgi:peptide chain release factor subunit 1
MAITDQLSTQLDRLADFEGAPYPVISLYLDMRPDDTGRHRFDLFLRKELDDRIETFGAAGPERDSLSRDADRIRQYVAEIDPATNGLAVFSCSAADLFETLPLAAPVAGHRLYISGRPHLYPLARLIDEYPRAAFLLANTNSARLFVVAGNAIERVQRVNGVKTKRHKMGGWSQARFQRHVDNFHLHHAKEVVEVLTRVVRDEDISSIVLAGDEVVVPMLRDQFPKDIAEKLVDVVKLDVRAPERDVLETIDAALKKKDAESDRERVERLLDEYRADGLAAVGVMATRRALDSGQVDELVITATPETLDAECAAEAAVAKQSTGAASGMNEEERIAGELVVKARQTAATVRFIEDPSLLQTVGGVGAFLRFKI